MKFFEKNDWNFSKAPIVAKLFVEWVLNGSVAWKCLFHFIYEGFWQTTKKLETLEESKNMKKECFLKKKCFHFFKLLLKKEQAQTRSVIAGRRVPTLLYRLPHTCYWTREEVFSGTACCGCSILAASTHNFRHPLQELPEVWVSEELLQCYISIC